MLFVIGVFVIDNIRTRRQSRSPRRSARASRAAAAEPTDDVGSLDADGIPDEGMRVPPEFAEHVGSRG
jgi:hypothetical protein